MSIIIPVQKKKIKKIKKKKKKNKKRLVNGCHEEIPGEIIDIKVSMAASPSHTSRCHLYIIMDSNFLVRYQLETKDEILSLG